jgi:hypothetical protein
MKKKALLIDILYKNTPYETSNETSIHNIGKILSEKFLYDEIIYLEESSDDSNYKPTKQNILNNLENLINNSNELTEIWIHYMGHSTIIIDEKNEYCQKGLVPIDYQDNGFIFDSELKKIFLSFKCKLFLFLDCCYGNYGFNIEHSIKMIEGRYIKESNTTQYTCTHNDNVVYAISMYMTITKCKNKKRKCFSNLLSRRFVQLMEKFAFKITIDRLISGLFKKLFDELYYSQIAILSSNKIINGKDMFVINLGNQNKLNLKHNLIFTEEEIFQEKLNDPIFKEIIESFGKSTNNNTMINNFNNAMVNEQKKKNIMSDSYCPNMNLNINTPGNYLIKKKSNIESQLLTNINIPDINVPTLNNNTQIPFKKQQNITEKKNRNLFFNQKIKNMIAMKKSNMKK